jgi:hypothetical protein
MEADIWIVLCASSSRFHLKLLGTEKAVVTKSIVDRDKYKRLIQASGFGHEIAAISAVLES